MKHRWSWEEKLNALQQFKNGHQHTNVPREYFDPVTGLPLGQWVSSLCRRTAHPTASQKADLKKLGFDWELLSPPVNEDVDFMKGEDRWQFMLELLKSYKELHRHTSPLQCEVFSGEPLGRWVDNQRYLYSRQQRSQKGSGDKGRKLYISDERVDVLNKIGFAWSAACDSQWEEMFQTLLRFKEQHGHASPLKRSEFNSVKLGRWVHNQRARLASLPPTHQRVVRLNGIGFQWDLKLKRTTQQQKDSQPQQRDNDSHAKKNAALAGNKKQRGIQSQPENIHTMKRTKRLGTCNHVDADATTQSREMIEQLYFHQADQEDKLEPYGGTALLLL